MSKTPRWGTIAAACKIIGGDRPINPSTYYRSAKAGLLPKPKKILPNVSRVDLDEVENVVRARIDSGETT